MLNVSRSNPTISAIHMLSCIFFCDLLTLCTPYRLLSVLSTELANAVYNCSDVCKTAHQSSIYLLSTAGLVTIYFTEWLAQLVKCQLYTRKARFESRPGHTKDFKNVTCCLLAGCAGCSPLETGRGKNEG